MILARLLRRIFATPSYDLFGGGRGGGTSEVPAGGADAPG